MKKEVHPKYYKDAVIHCACGKIFKMGATKPEMHVEICSFCHPLYTGKNKVIDAAGRVEKFKKRLEKTAEKKKSKGKK